MFFSRTYLDTLEDRTIRLLRQLFIAPVSNVTCNKSFVSYANIYELANYCQCIYHKLNLGRSSQNKTEKEKQLARFN